MDEERLAQIESAILELADAVRQVCEKVAAMDEEVNKLEQSGIFDRLDRVESDFGSMVGGFTDIMNGRRKRRFADEFTQGHPEFGKYSDIGKRFGLDVVGIASDKAFDYEESGDASDEGRQALIESMLQDLASKFDDLLELMANKPPAAEMPAAGEHEGDGSTVEVEITNEEPSGPDDKLKEAARRFRGARPY